MAKPTNPCEGRTFTQVVETDPNIPFYETTELQVTGMVVVPFTAPNTPKHTVSIASGIKPATWPPEYAHGLRTIVGVSETKDWALKDTESDPPKPGLVGHAKGLNANTVAMVNADRGFIPLEAGKQYYALFTFENLSPPDQPDMRIQINRPYGPE